MSNHRSAIGICAPIKSDRGLHLTGDGSLHLTGDGSLSSPSDRGRFSVRFQLIKFTKE